MKVADEVWTSVALLHQENPAKTDFAVDEIKARARRENWQIRPGFNVHASYHCLANKPANPANHRMLHENSRGRRRLYRVGDPFHPERENGKIRPDKLDLPAAYQPLVDWYDTIYSKQPPSTTLVPTGSNEDSSASSAPAAWSEMQSATAFVNSAGAVVIPDDLLKELGIHEGTRISIYREDNRVVLQAITKEFIHSLVGCCKGEDSLVAAREREHRIEKDRMAK